MRSREATMVTLTPSSANAETNSAPVTPEPTTMRWEGRSFSPYICRQFKMRSPSGSAPLSTRGLAPTDTSTMLQMIVSLVPSASCTSMVWVVWPVCSLPKRARPSMKRTPLRSSWARMSPDCSPASDCTRSLSAKSDNFASPSAWLSPISSARRRSFLMFAPAIKLLEGTTSLRIADPPAPLSSMIVMSAPYLDAISAAS